MKTLLSGIHKFNSEVFPHLKPEFELLSKGQSPKTLLITCSDSRVVPNLLTQTSPGDLFLVRNAGNIVPSFANSRSSEEAAVEYAVDSLRVTNIVICGHTQCGAMSALLTPERIEALPALKAWLYHAQATKKRVDVLKHTDDQLLLDVIQENILVQINNLKTHPPVSAALLENRIRIYGWVYHFESGRVDMYDRTDKKFIPANEIHEESLDSGRFEL